MPIDICVGLMTVSAPVCHQFDGTFCNLLKFSVGEVAILELLSDAQGNLSAVQNLLETLCCIWMQMLTDAIKLEHMCRELLRVA